MRILYITSTTELHGSTLSLLSLLDGVVAHDDTPFVIVPNADGPLCKILQQKNIQYFKVPLTFFCYPQSRPYGKIWFLFDIKNILKVEYKAERKLSKIISQVKPDLIHTNVGPIVTGHFVAKKHNIPHIWHIREYGDIDFNMKMFPCKKFYRRLLSKDFSIFITKNLQQYNHFESNDKSTVIYNGVCQISNTIYNEKKESYFLSASRVSPEKNIDEIIKAFSEFHKNHPNYKLKILGDGPQEYLQNLKDLCIKLNCTDSVHFKGFKEDIFSYMQNAKALIVASHAEGFGRMTAEAIFAGSIVIGKNAGGTKEIINQTGGFLYSSEKELLEYMGEIANMAERDYYTLVCSSQQKAKELFSKEQYIQNIYQVYKNILKKKMPTDKRLIAINLPQFHPFKENDEWWGKGFTEWTNVVKARPRFKRHYQPHLPADTGFYDLRLPEAREMQAEMARKYGIYGFCYYHYWFNGKQLMERPINEILASGKPDFPFMLCWANENWTRAWDGGEKEILIEQHYSKDDDIKHMEYLCKNVFSDSRYIRIDNRPFFAVYKPELFPNIKETIKLWRMEAEKYGVQLYLGFMRSDKTPRRNFLEAGFDISIDFQPHFIKKTKWWLDPYAWIDGIRNCLLRKKDNIMPVLFDYHNYVKSICSSFHSTTLKEFPGITPNWDNTPRRQKKSFWAFKNSTPKEYGKWLRFLLDNFQPYSSEENFIFVNAWNEWAEGSHLEPDQKWGLAYLEETKNQLST